MTAVPRPIVGDTPSPALNGAEAVAALAALGNPTRLHAFRLIVGAAGDGVNVGTLQAMLDTPASTLNHHLNTLVRAGLVRQHRHGREILNLVEAPRVAALAQFLQALTPAADHRFGNLPQD
ncbi:Transcriptional regulator, ArsR family, putative (modular protein) [uncultured Alphaproteobacteria bacterium]|uniref:Transcriptional regulator, ArsR family, putative (Modular protein) n=1 Tax=uncultured Alphaproteobacteria bacterium TaxID=91750 RepID=A0A212JDE4_9PROT|nr:Transcriptional regulator, ArsR family, putative (modular protein) [uncultured Alphaproteobacteria bacterium]